MSNNIDLSNNTDSRQVRHRSDTNQNSWSAQERIVLICLAILGLTIAIIGVFLMSNAIGTMGTILLGAGCTIFLASVVMILGRSSRRVNL